MRRALSSERGQTFVEYALLIAVLVVGGLLATSMTGLAAAMQAALNVVTGAF